MVRSRMHDQAIETSKEVCVKSKVESTVDSFVDNGWPNVNHFDPHVTQH